MNYKYGYPLSDVTSKYSEYTSFHRGGVWDINVKNPKKDSKYVAMLKMTSDNEFHTAAELEGNPAPMRASLNSLVKAGLLSVWSAKEYVRKDSSCYPYGSRKIYGKIWFKITDKGHELLGKVA